MTTVSSSQTDDSKSRGLRASRDRPPRGLPEGGARPGDLMLVQKNTCWRHCPQNRTPSSAVGRKVLATASAAELERYTAVSIRAGGDRREPAGIDSPTRLCNLSRNSAWRVGGVSAVIRTSGAEVTRPRPDHAVQPVGVDASRGRSSVGAARIAASRAASSLMPPPPNDPVQMHKLKPVSGQQRCGSNSAPLPP